MRVIIDDLKKKYVRKFTTEKETVFYAVTVSVCRNMSSDGFVTFVCDEEHIHCENNHFVVEFPYDIVRVFKITDTHGFYTTAEMLLSEVVASHLASVFEREQERQAARREEMRKVLYDTIYFSLYVSANPKDKIFHSYKSIGELKKDVCSQVYRMIDTELNSDIINGGRRKYDIDIFADADGKLIVRHTIYKRNAFAGRKGEDEYVVGDIKETKYYVRNDKHMCITLWDWDDVLEDIRLRQIEDDEILNEERTEEEWKQAQEIAMKNAKSGFRDIRNLSKQFMERFSEVKEENVVPQNPFASSHMPAAG